MLEIPTVVFYVATVALVIVCILLAVLLALLIVTASAVRRIARMVEEDLRRARGSVEKVRRLFQIAATLFTER